MANQRFPHTSTYHLHLTDSRLNTSTENASLPCLPNRTSISKTFASSQVAGTLGASDLIGGKKRKRRKTVDTLSNLWWPSGLFFLVLLLFYGALIADAARPGFGNEIETGRSFLRWKRNIPSNPIPKDAALSSESTNEQIQRLTTTQAPLTQKTTNINQTAAPYTPIPGKTSLNSLKTTLSSTVSDIVLDSESIIVFIRTVHYNGKEFKNPEKKTEEFKINSAMTGELKFECESGIRNRRYPRNNITFETYWVNAQSFEVVSNNSVLTFDNAWERLKGVESLQFRCAARLEIPIRSVKSVIHSRYLALQPVNDPALQIKPLSVDLIHMESARLECEYNVTGDEVQEFIWINGTVPVLPHPDYKIYTTQTRSILYIFNSHLMYGREPYSCQVLLKSGKLLNSTHMAKLNVYDETKDLVDTQTQILPAESLEARVNEDLSIECWKPDAKHIRWYRIHSSALKEIISTEPVLLFKNASARLNGEYECQIEDPFGIVRFYRVEVYVDDNFFQLEPVTYSIIRKNQGTPAKLLCRTFSRYEEQPQMAEWFKDGSLLNSPEDLVYRRTSLVEDIGREGRAVYVAMAQVEDQGFYECIIRKKDTERAQQTLLLVEQTTKVKLLNLNMTVDHTRGCFSSHFDVPPEIDFRIAQTSTYFLIYYLADMSKSLNIIPGTQGAKCTSDNKCTISCWTPSYPFDPATEYTFRLSAVFPDDTSVITPFSDAVNATSWDGPPTRAIQLNWIYDATKKELTLNWERPKMIGTLQHYYLDLFDIKPHPLLNEKQIQQHKLKLPANKEFYKIGDASAPFILQMRLIPMTRSGLPPAHQLQSEKDFGYTLLVADEEVQPVDMSIHAPEVQIQQIDSEPKFELNFNKPTLQEQNVTSIRIQYRPLANVHTRMPQSSKEVIEVDTEMREANSDGKPTVVLRRGLKPGNIYQICAAYERHSTPLTLGFWHCEIVPLLDSGGELNTIREDSMPVEARQLIPNPINCQKANCTCAQSPEDHNLVLVRWCSSNDLSYKQNFATKYVVHYVINGTDVETKDANSRFYRDGNDTVLELRGLFPTLDYNIMIEAQNELGVGLDGTYFPCKAPNDLDLPPPEPTEVNVMGNSGAAQLYWKPPIPVHLIETVPDFNGYMIHYRTGNASEHLLFTEGHKQNSELLSSLQHGSEYSVYLTSHSAKKKDSPLMSKTIFIKVPALKQEPLPEKPSDHDKVKDLLAADANLPWYKTLRFRAYFVLAIIGMLIILCFAGLTALISGKYFDWSHRTKEQRRLKKLKKAPSMGGISSGRASNASSRLSLNSIGSGSRVPAASEQEHLIPNLYGLPYRESKHKKNLLDMKGGPHGYKPKVHQANRLDDPAFKQKVREVNKDPTGLGKPWNEILDDLKRTQEEELALMRQKEEECHHVGDIEMQTFSIHHQHPYPSNSGTSAPSISSSTSKHSRKHRHSSGSNRRRPKLHRQIAESSPLTGVNRQISSIDDDENDAEPIGKKESVQAEVHQEPNRRSIFASNNTNRLPSKTYSLNDLTSVAHQPKRVVPNTRSDSWLQDPVFIQKHREPLRRHFLKRPSIISLQNNRCYPSETASTLQTPQSPHPPCSEQVIVHTDQQSSHSAPLEFHLGANGIERRRLKTTTAAPTHQQQRKKYSVGGNIATASLPNLNDSGIVYDESGHQHHHTYFHHPSHDCPSGLHPIVSMKLLRLTKDEEAKNGEQLEETSTPPDFFHPRQDGNLDELRAPVRRQSLADGESAVSTSSGASSHGSGASNRYELEDAENDDDNSQLISPQTPVKTFGSTPGAILLSPTVYLPTPATKDYCSIQMCNFNSSAHEDKRPLEMLNNESLNDGLQTWYPGNV